MERRSLVQLHSLLSVVPGKPVDPPGKLHSFSPIDHAMAFHTLHALFYYRTNPFATNTAAGLPSEIDNLRVSLSPVLDAFPTVTGRLARDTPTTWRVKCNDAGARMLHAAVDATLDEWLESSEERDLTAWEDMPSDPTFWEERDLTAWEDMPSDPTFWSPFRIQINNFKCGGIAIGLSWTHMHADIASATLLIKSWAEAHSGRPVAHSPILDLSPSPFSSPSRSFHLSPRQLSPPAKMSTVTMEFSGPAIESCLSQVQKEYPSVNSPFEFLAALFWSRIVRFQKPLLKRSMSICVDLRSFGAVPCEYFGNALHFSVVEMESVGLQCGGVAAVSDHIRQHIEGVKGDDVGSVVRWLEEQDWKESFPVYGSRLTCVNMEHVGMYGVVFGEEQPVRVTHRVGKVDGEGMIMVMPSPDGGRGRTVTVVLPDDQVDELCKDPSVLDLKPGVFGRETFG